MLKKRLKSNIINALLLIILLVLNIPVMLYSAGEEADYTIKPAYIFKYEGNRDPFELQDKKDVTVNTEAVDISSFLLLGITDNGGLRAALFKSKSGSPFGFIFMNGSLFADNGRVVEGIQGTIEDDKNVKLVQGDNEVIFSIEDNYTGPNIRPE